MRGRFDSSLCLCLCLCQTNLHMRVAMQAPPNRTTITSQWSPQAECLFERGAIRSRVGSTTARKSSLAVIASSALLGARRWQPTRSAREEGQVTKMLCNLP